MKRGYAALSESGGGTEIENLYILPKIQGKGFGKQYIRRLLENSHWFQGSGK